MLSSFFIVIASLLSVFAPIAILIFAISISQLNAHRKTGYFYLLPYFILFAAGFDIYISGRQLDNEGELWVAETARSFFGSLPLKISTIFMISVSLERITNYFSSKEGNTSQSKMLAISFVFFWVCAVLMPSTITKHASFHHDSVYTLLATFALITLSPEELTKFLIASRNALNAFIFVSFALIFLNPGMILQFNYIIGFIPGLPRMGGLAPHQTMFGALSFITIILNIELPLKSRLFKAFFVSISVIGLFMAQAKAVWVSALFISFIYLFINYKRNSHNYKNSQLPLIAIGSLFFILSISVTVLMGLDLPGKISNFLNSSEGSRITSVTGRDVIWDVAIQTWRENPLFGYGSNFLNVNHRISVGLPMATHAHNQYLDLMARSGLIGLFSFLIFLFLILRLIFKQDVVNKGFALAMFVCLIYRCFSEVPVNLFGYGNDYLIFMITIASALISTKNMQSKLA